MDVELRCPVCHDLFREPAMLQCAHHVCMVHLGNLSSRDRLSCPVCNDVTFVPECGMTVDRVLQMIVDKFERSQTSTAQAVPAAPPTPPICGFCEERPATKRCVQCVGALCEECVETSHSKGFFKSHTIVNLEDPCPTVESVGAVAISDGAFGTYDILDCTKHQMLCDTHPEEKLNFYCLDCRRPVCSHCLILGDHKGHQQTTIDTAFDTGKETLGAWVEKLSQRILHTQDLLDQLHASELEVNRGAEAQRNVINNEMDHLRELIETKRHQLLSKSALEEKQKRVQLQEKKDRAELTRKEAEDFVSRSQGLLSMRSEHAFLAVVLPLIQDMKKCAGHPVDTAAGVSCSYRPLSTDAQVRSIGDLDLGHPRHPATQAQAASPHIVQSASVPNNLAVSQTQSAAVHGQPAVHGQQPGYTMVGSGATVSYLQPHQVPVQQQVQYVYRTVPAQ